MMHSGFFGRRWVVVVSMIGGLLLGGCEISTQPQDISHFSTTRAGTEDLAEYDGIYQLFGDDTDQVSGPLLKSVRLKKGEVVGFEIGPDHVPVAVAGADRQPLQPGHYRWQMTPDAGQTDWHRTDVVVIEVLVATGVVILIVVGTAAAVKGL